MTKLFESKMLKPEDVRQKLRELETPTILIFSYDESLREYDGVDFRKILIEKFLRFERGCGLLCPVSTTVYIRTHKEKSLNVWSAMINEKFKGIDSFYFTIAEVTHKDFKFVLDNHSINPELKKHFDDLVIEISAKVYPK